MSNLTKTAYNTKMCSKVVAHQIQKGRVNRGHWTEIWAQFHPSWITYSRLGSRVAYKLSSYSAYLPGEKVVASR